MQYFTRRNIRAASLALLIFLYPIVALSFFQIRYVETVHRITMSKTFDVSLFGSIEFDSLAAIGFGLLFMGLSSRLKISKVAFGLIFVAALSAYFTAEGALVIAALAIAPAISALLVSAAIADRKRPLHSGARRLPLDGKRVAAMFLGIVIIIEAGALARWIAYPFVPGEIYGDISWKFAEIESALIQSFGLALPVMMSLIIFSFLFKDSLPEILKRARHGSTDPNLTVELTKISKEIKIARGSHAEPLGGRITRKSNVQLLTPEPILEKPQATASFRLREISILAGAVIVSIVISIYPHMPGVNQTGSGVSTDERSYLEWIGQLRSVQNFGLAETISTAFRINEGDRPLSFLVMMWLGDLTSLPDETIVRFVPVLLGPGLVISSYCLVKYGYTTSNSKGNQNLVPAIVAVAAAISPQIVVGTYGGFLSNWLALIPGFISMLLAVKISEEAFRSDSNKQARVAVYSFGLFAALILTMLFHVYTWGYIVIVTFVFCVISLALSGKISAGNSGSVVKMGSIVICILVASVVVDYAKSSYFELKSGFSRDTILESSNFALGNFSSKWDTFSFTLGSYLGGFLTTAFIAALALLWIFKGGYAKSLDRLIFSSLFVLVIPFLFGNSVIQARLLYVVPLFIPAILAIYHLNKPGSKLSTLLVVAFVLSLAVYSLRAMAGLHLIVPEHIELDNPFLVS